MATLQFKMPSEQLRSEDFSIPDREIEALLNQNIRQVFSLDDPAWLEVASHDVSNKRLGLRALVRRMITDGRNARSQAEVRSAYEEFWIGAPTEDHVERQNERSVAVRWRDRGAVASPQLLRQVHMAFFMRAIEALKPRNVLEVGCGNANVLFTLAGRFPDVRFSGVELTKAGVEAAKALQLRRVLPASIIEASPQPIVDPGAYIHVDVREADACALPFPARSFDLVYTRIALEQMEAIRNEALSEITRVAGAAVVLLEPWRDYNDNGPGRDYVRRQGYFAARIRTLESYGFDVVYSTADLPQKVQFSVGPAVALRRNAA